jgi:hypothetical protein
MKVDVNEKERRRRKLRNLPRRTQVRLIWEVVRWLLILGPRVAQLIEWFRS